MTKKVKSFSDPMKWLVIREGASQGRIYEAESAELAAAQAARHCSVGGLRKGERLTVAPLAESTSFVAQYDPPDWTWNDPPNEKVVLRVA